MTTENYIKKCGNPHWESWAKYYNRRDKLANEYLVVGASRGKMPLESNGVGINSRRVHAESVVSAFQHPTYTTEYFLFLLGQDR